jgi:prepilin-type N-terminal cleavage/methylation domain-containing protein
MKKGFTLVELLGVIIILAIIATIIVPVATSLINKSTNQLNTIQLGNIKSGAVNWATDNIDKVPGSSSDYNAVEVTLTTLIKGGYISSDIKDITTKNAYVGDSTYVVISYDSTNKHLTYDVYQSTTSPESASFLLADTNRVGDPNGYLVAVGGTKYYTCTKTGCVSTTTTVSSNTYTFTDGFKILLVVQN